MGRRAVITAFDGGAPQVSPDEITRGWRQDAETVVTNVINSYDEIILAISDEYAEVWLYSEGAAVPSLATWEHLAGELNTITLTQPELEYPMPPKSWDAEVVLANREWLEEVQARLRDGLGAYRPLTFLRDDLIVTRDAPAIAALERYLAELSRCHCPTRGDAAWVLPNEPQFVRPYDLLERGAGRALFRCRTCGAFWAIEGASALGDGVAQRLSAATAWESADLVSARRQLLLRTETEGDQPCRHQGCLRRALRGRELCVDHAYGLI